MRVARHRNAPVLLVAAAAILTGTLVADAAVHVSSDGIDSAACGAGGAPSCATIAQAVSNAADGDTILVGPGLYNGATVFKRVSLLSAAGTGGAVIVSPIMLAAPGARLGKAGRGFAIRAGGVVVAADDVTVRGNVISSATTCIAVSSGNRVVLRDNTINACGTGINVTVGSDIEIRGNVLSNAGSAAIFLGAATSAAVVRDNRIQGPGLLGVQIGGSGHLLRRNFVQGTQAPAFYSADLATDVELVENLAFSTGASGFQVMSGSGWVLRRNAAMYNAAPGLLLFAGTPVVLESNISIGNAAGIQIAGGDGHVVVGNTAVQNLGPGLILAPTAPLTVSGGNLYGNAQNCGLVHTGTGVVTAERNYWGAPGGPGVDPADQACGNTAMVVLSGYADSAATMKMPPIK